MAVSLPCNAWTCEVCAERRSRELIDRIVAGAPERHIVLTSVVGSHPTPDLAAAAMMRGWRMLKQAIARNYPRVKCSFAWFFEATKQGWPHLHVAQRGCYIDHDWLSLEWSKLTGASIVWIEAVRGARNAAKYLSKYIGSDMHKFGTCKRYGFSRGWEIVQPEARDQGAWAGLKWQYDKRPVSEIGAWWRRAGFQVEYTDHGRTVFYGTPPPRRSAGEGARAWQ